MKLALLAVLAGCGLEKMPPIAIVRAGAPSPVKRVVQLPIECDQPQLCTGLDAIVASELSFRGYEIIDLDRLAAIERTRTEVQVTWQTERDGAVDSGGSRSVEVRGPMLSDLDMWTLRDELAKMGVDSVVRVRTADVTGKPDRIAALVRITRADNAMLIASALCELEVGTFDTYAEGAERSTRCALAKVLR